MVRLGVWKTRGQQNKRGDPPIFFRIPPLAGRGAKRKGGARTPRTPPEYAPVYDDNDEKPTRPSTSLKDN